MKRVYLIIDVRSCFPLSVLSSRKAAQDYMDKYYVQRIGYDSSLLRVSEYNLLGSSFVDCMLKDDTAD